MNPCRARRFRSPVVRLLADPLSWWLMRELATGDQRVGELPAAVGQPQNLVSYHLRQLRSGATPVVEVGILRERGDECLTVPAVGRLNEVLDRGRQLAGSHSGFRLPVHRYRATRRLRSAPLA